MNIILAGFQGVGKTSCGKLLAATMGFAFIDTDALLCATHDATTARALYQRVGQMCFRELEGVLLQKLQTSQNTVIALGGGSLLAPDAEVIVPQIGRLIYLYLPLQVLLADRSRFGMGAFLTERSFEEHYLERHALFSRVCHERIDVENLDIEDVVKKLL